MDDHRIAPLYVVLDSRQCKYSALNMGTAKFTFTLILCAVFQYINNTHQAVLTGNHWCMLNACST